MSRSRSQAGNPLKSLLKFRSLGSVVFLAVLLFYVAWPLYAGYEIKSSLEAADTAGLSARIDFPSVRTSLRPAVAKKVDAVVTDALLKGGTAGGALADQLKARVMPRIVDGVLAALVTPEMLIRIHASGKSFKEAIDGMVLERASQAEGFGGLLIVPGDEAGGGKSKIEEIAGAFGIDTKKVLGGGIGATTAEAESGEAPAALPAKSGGGERPKYGLGNIKHFSLTGPFGLSVGVARNPNARKPELTAEMRFVDGTWMLTGLVPQI